MIKLDLYNFKDNNWKSKYVIGVNNPFRDREICNCLFKVVFSSAKLLRFNNFKVEIELETNLQSNQYLWIE